MFYIHKFSQRSKEADIWQQSLSTQHMRLFTNISQHLNEGRMDSSVGKSGNPGSIPVGGLTRVTQCTEWEWKRLPAVKVVLHQLAWLTDA